MEGKERIKVFLIDDHPMLLGGIRALLAGYSEIVVVGDGSDRDGVIRKARQFKPDVFVLDINLPSIDGAQLARDLLRIFPACKILVYSVFDDAGHIMRMLRSGAHGYVTKGEPPERLVKGIRIVSAGGTYILRDIVEEVAQSVALTEREEMVLRLLTNGLSNKEAADKMGISFRTIETHREHLYCKLNIHSLAGLIKYAIRQGLIGLDQ